MALTTASAVTGAVVALALLADGKYQLRKDITNIWQLKRAQREWERAVKSNKASLWYQFEKQSRRLPESTTCIWSRSGSYTWLEAEAQSLRFAQFFLSHGVRPGDLVAVYLHNSPEFLFQLLGTWAIGAAPAMINYNLAGDSLLHCLKISRSKILLVDEDSDCCNRIEEIRDRVEQELGMRIIILDKATKDLIAGLEPERPDDRYRDGVTGQSPIFFLYTSGTTGLPKGSIFHLERAWYVGEHRRRVQRQVAGPDGDVFYDCMPLYHGTGCVSACGCLTTGITVAIGRKFSTSGFWDDIRDSGATAFVYVGETARYLLSAPPSPKDKDHKVRFMYGNGLRPDVWKKFQERFGVREVYEFFNSTEGVFGLSNESRNDFSANAVGHHGAIFRKLMANTYVPVEIDHDTGDIWRDAETGFAKRAPYEKGGEMLVNVPDETVFTGYWDNPEATAKRFTRDVFQKGDLYYRSGDSLRRDSEGRWFFMDRLGDTFRWKGENCSTAEVAEFLGRFHGIKEANVYGVQLPAHDGRACCAAIYVDPADRGSFDLAGLLKHSRRTLPKYAVPLFLRFVKDPAPTMHNNKQNKGQLRREGVDPDKVANGQAGRDDVLFWLPPKGDIYEHFGEKEWDSLVAGKSRL